MKSSRRRTESCRPSLGAVVAVVAALLMPATASGAVLRPAADFSVSAARPTANYGAAKHLIVARRPAQRAFVRFDLGAPLPRGTRVLLRLYPLRDAPQGVLLRHASDRPWRERAETFRTAPRTGPRSIRSGPLRGLNWKTIDVTDLVGPAPTVSLALSTTAARPVLLASREARTIAPKLVVEAPAPPPPLGKPLRPVVPPVAPPPVGGPVAPPPSSPSAATPCVAGARPAAWQHVVWVVMENKSYEHVIGAPDSPFVTALAARCGLATAYSALASVSVPNYLAMASGDTQGLGDVQPPTILLPAPSIFSQLGSDWRTLAESMPGNCMRVGDLLYTPRHNPAVYFNDAAASCATANVPLANPPDLSARFTLLEPNKCSSTHDCTVATGDAWLSQMMPKLLDSPEYRSGSTVIFLTWDEAEGAGDHIATLVMSPSTVPGTQDATPYTHYSLLRTTEEILGLPFLANAATATSMRGGFGL
jgi:phosphatidylinositol-3-phosphatase